MPRRPARHGLLALLWAVLQLALPLGATLADAHEARAGAAVVAHVESGSTDGCRPAHTEDCAVCRVLGALHGAPPAAAAFDCPAARAPRIDAPRALAAGAAPLALPQPRAPPAA